MGTDSELHMAHQCTTITSPRRVLELAQHTTREQCFMILTNILHTCYFKTPDMPVFVLQWLDSDE